MSAHTEDLIEEEDLRKRLQVAEGRVRQLAQALAAYAPAHPLLSGIA